MTNNIGMAEQGPSAAPKPRYGEYDAEGANRAEIAVRVTSVDFNGQSFDGSPFSVHPQWLQDAVNAFKILISREHGDRDYAVWLVKCDDGGEKNAFPGDYIIRRERGGLSVVDAQDAYILINLRPPVIGDRENNADGSRG